MVMVEPRSQTALIECLRLMLRPLAKFCLKRSLSIQDMIESVKIAFLHAAADELKVQGEKVNMSRLSAITGLQRRAVVRIFREGETKESPNLTIRVIGQWQRDEKFLTDAGQPRTLTYEGDNSEFRKLVHTVSSELHPRSVLVDLERIGAVKLTKDGVKLVTKTYVPRKNSLDLFRLLADDMDDLISAVMDNSEFENRDRPNVHLKTHFDNVPAEDLPKIRKWLSKHAYFFHRKAEKFLSQHDLDIKPNKLKKGGARVAIGFFSRT